MSAVPNSAGRWDAVAIYDYYDIARAENIFDASVYVAFPIGP